MDGQTRADTTSLHAGVVDRKAGNPIRNRSATETTSATSILRVTRAMENPNLARVGTLKTREIS